MSDKPLAKSLHTVTVLVNLTLFLMYTDCSPIDPALTKALRLLHLHNKPDDYGLIAQARKQIVVADPARAIAAADHRHV